MPLLGLYGHSQGTQVDSVWDSEEVARTIAAALGKTFKVPKNSAPAVHRLIDDDEHFQDQLKRLFMTPDSEEQQVARRLSGGWPLVIVIRPRKFLSQRIESYLPYLAWSPGIEYTWGMGIIPREFSNESLPRSPLGGPGRA